jgi:hypothetical protein
MPAMIRRFVLLVLFLVGTQAVVRQAWALGQESFGPAGEHVQTSPEWPDGVEPLLRHPSRVYWNWVNGNEHAYFDGGIDTVNELLELFGLVDLPQHNVVLLPGRPSAQSFHGQKVPYTVELELPGGIYLHHIRQFAQTGLYSDRPRLIVHVDSALVENLDELRVSDKVMLHPSAHRVDDALKHVSATDRSLRGRAISILGEIGESPPAVVDALEDAAKDPDDEYIRNTARSALEQLAAANDPDARALRERLSTYLEDHPRRARTLEPDALLAALRAVDLEYAEGFTARGTLVRPGASEPHPFVAWTITMGNDRLVLQQRAVEDDEHRPTPGQIENTIYVGPRRMATIQRHRVRSEGDLIDTKPFISFEPVGSTYDLLIGRLLWPLGRGFSRRIDRITQITQEADGTLAVTAASDEGNLMARWELRIDPASDYLVRAAQGFRKDDAQPTYAIDTAGVLSAADRSTAHTARWIEGEAADPLSIAVNSLSATADMELIRQTEELLKGEAGGRQ